MQIDMLLSVPEIPGLYLMPNVFSVEQETSNMHELKELDGGNPCPQVHNATEFGWKFLPVKPKTIEDKLHDELPEPIASIWTQMKTAFPEKISNKIKAKPDHVLFNEYGVGDGCKPHVDNTIFWQNYVVGASFGSGCTMRFTQIDNSEKSFEIFLPARSAYIMISDARFHWYHEILFDTTDNFYGKEIKRKLRYSLTYRAITKMYLPKTPTEELAEMTKVKNESDQ